MNITQIDAQKLNIQKFLEGKKTENLTVKKNKKIMDAYLSLIAKEI